MNGPTMAFSNTTTAKCEPRLLRDKPSSIPEDAPQLKEFNASFERVISALASLISPGAGGSVIGIVGGWGSGKSTVVRWLGEELRRRDQQYASDTFYWTFDAWAHEGD